MTPWSHRRELGSGTRQASFAQMGCGIGPHAYELADKNGGPRHFSHLPEGEGAHFERHSFSTRLVQGLRATQPLASWRPAAEGKTAKLY